MAAIFAQCRVPSKSKMNAVLKENQTERSLKPCPHVVCPKARCGARIRNFGIEIERQRELAKFVLIPPSAEAHLDVARRHLEDQGTVQAALQLQHSTSIGRLK